jgi:hypothetical protein
VTYHWALWVHVESSGLNEKTTRFYKRTGFVLEPAGYEEKRKTKKYIEKRLGKA